MQGMRLSINKYLEARGKNHRERGVLRYIPVVVLMCFTVGIFIANIMNMGQTENLGMWNRFFIEKFKYTPIHSAELFYYILGQRIPVLMILFLFLATNWGTLAGTIFLGWQGFAAGFLMATTVVAYGVKGILLMVTVMLPQYFVYIPVYIGYLYLCVYYKNNIKKDGNSRGTERRQETFLFLLIPMFMLVLYIMGIFMESYINPQILKNILKIF